MIIVIQVHVLRVNMRDGEMKFILRSLCRVKQIFMLQQHAGIKIVLERSLSLSHSFTVHIRNANFFLF